jgi:hypothetical protein
MTNLLRQPKGQPIGGQFAPSANPEAAVALYVAMSDVTFKAACSGCPGGCSVNTQQESMDWKRKHEKFTKHKVELSWSRVVDESITSDDEETAMSNHDHVSRENAGLTDLAEVACSRPAVPSRNCVSVGSLSDCGESVSPRMSVRER